MRRMRRKGARLCSILLALVLLLSLMPTQVAFASDADSETTLEVTQPEEDHEDKPVPAAESEEADESIPKQEKKDDVESVTPVKSDAEDEKTVSAAASDDVDTDQPADPGENDPAEEAPATSTNVDAVQDEDDTDADQPAEPEEDTDPDEDDAQISEDEGFEQPVEAAEEEVVLEETVVVEPAAVLMSIQPVFRARAAQTRACVECGQPMQIDQSYDDEEYHQWKCTNHVGSYLLAWNKHNGGKATCTQKAICETCGRAYGKPLGHDWADWKYDLNDEANHYRVCKRDGCGAKETEAHHADVIRNSAPTYHNYVCFVCNTLWGFEYHSEPHSFGEWKDNGDGTHSRSCICSRTETVEHTFGDWEDNGDGTHSRSCICGATETVAHTYTWTYVDDDTHKGVCACGAQTTEAHYDRWASTCGRQPRCEKCDHDYGSIPEHEMWYQDCGENGHKPSCYHCDTYFFLEAHSYSDWKDNGDGTHTGKCVCGRTQTVEHSGGTATCTSGPICDDCGAEYDKPLGHDLKETARMEPTCTSTGTEAYWTCQRDGCGKLFSDAEGKNEITEPVVIKALGHDLIHHDAQAATCTEVGWEAYDTCSRCDYSTYKEIPALGHDLIHHDAQVPTCTEIGWEAYDTCSRCDYSTYKEISALDHDLKGMAKVEPTCTEAGTEADWMCQRDGCGKMFSDAEGKNEIEAPVVIPALGHDLKATAKAEPTCTESGTEAYWTCQRDDCGKLFSDAEGKNEIKAPVVIPALGHDLKETAKVEPTCTSTGTEAYWTCQRDGCGKLFSDAEGKTEIDAPVVIKALGHDWGEWQVTKAPQIGKTGERQRICSRCKEKETEAIAALIGYDVISGADGSWTKGSDKAYTITVKRSEDDASCFAHYVETLIDGKTVVVSAKAGSTVVTISAGTLEELSAGTHTVTVKFDDGQATTKLTVKNRTASTDSEPSKPTVSNPTKSTGSDSPQTGDNSNIGLWLALMLLSAAAVTALLISSRKKKASS